MRAFGSSAAALALLAALGGCVGAAAEGANIARDRVVVANNLEEAEAGDPEAQYRVGKALCCSLHEGEGFYDTPRSVAFLCRAAEQGHGPAAHKLGAIYSGEVVSGLRVMRRVAQRVAGSSTAPVVAYAWTRRAESLGVAEAAADAGERWAALSESERDEAAAMLAEDTLPCDWQSVIGPS